MTIEQINRNLLSFASHIDDNTIEQAKDTASMPFVHPHVALMPDAHSGKGSAVGTVIPTIDAVIPAAVGVDIGCGMIAARTIFTADDLAGKVLGELREAIEGVIPLSPGKYNSDVREGTWAEHTDERIELLQNLAWPGDDGEDQTHRNVDLSHSPKWREQLGSLGGGNHFIELCLDEADRVWLFLHSGSRGVGNKIAQKHIKVAQKLCQRWWINLPNPDLAYLPQGTPEFTAYLRELNWAQRFALENRAEMMDRFRYVFAEWMGFDCYLHDVGSAIETERINTHHNYTRKERHGGRDVWLTRKGAIDAHEGVPGIIPGSMGTRSYIVRGKGQRGWAVLGAARRWPAVLPQEGARAVYRGRSRGSHDRYRVPARRGMGRRDSRCLQRHRRRHGRCRRASRDRAHAAPGAQREGGLMTIVTVYTSGPSCMACTQTKRHLDRRGIAYTEQPLDEANTAAAIELGYATAPVVCVSVDGVESSWAGYRPDRIDAIVGAA